jgi:hypothetical protein
MIGVVNSNFPRFHLTRANGTCLRAPPLYLPSCVQIAHFLDLECTFIRHWSAAVALPEDKVMFLVL